MRAASNGRGAVVEMLLARTDVDPNLQNEVSEQFEYCSRVVWLLGASCVRGSMRSRVLLLLLFW